MRLHAEPGQLVGLAIASAVFTLGLWLQLALVDRNWPFFLCAELVLLAFLWGVGLWVLSRYRDEWGPVFPWNWRTKDEPEDDD